MANIFTSLIEKLGLSKATIIDQAENLIEQNRDKIPDAIEGQIDSALHGDMVDGLLDKVGIGGEEATATDVEAVAEEVVEEETK
jgi:hypothetical protein